jgi:hypothetical protein
MQYRDNIQGGIEGCETDDVIGHVMEIGAWPVVFTALQYNVC